jgi:hypothetical protein
MGAPELTRPVRAAAVVVLLALFFSIASTTAIRKSNTWDESAHILAGYAYLAESMDYLSPLNHTVLGRSISGFFPWLLLDLDFDPAVKPEGAPGSNFFPYSLKFLFENRTPGMTVLIWARLGNMLVGCLLGLFVYLWSAELWGVRGGLFSLFLYALSPNILAHAGLATTDMPVTAFFFLSAFFLYRLATRGISALDLFAAAAFISLALTTKHTALLLGPLVAASFFATMRIESVKKTAVAYVFLIVTVYAAIWAIYGFRFHSQSLNYVQPVWGMVSGSVFAPLFDLLRSMKFLPEAYLYSLAGALSSAGTGREAYLLGEFSVSGWWYYFPITFLIKTPVPTLLFLAATVVYIFTAGTKDRVKALCLIAPVLLVFLTAASQKVNIGLRHVLPAYPFIFALLGFVPGIRTGSVRAAKGVFSAACLWYVVAAAIIYPHQLAYFNEFVGGPDNGHRYLIDSNMDWGQDLIGLKDYMDDNGIERIKLGYFGYTDPRYYGIDYVYMPSHMIKDPQLPEGGVVALEGWFAVSATLLQGGYLPDRDFYITFRETEPVDKVGYSIFLYRF